MYISRFLLSLFFFLCSCGIKQKINYSSEYIIPDKKFNDREVRLPLDYNNKKNWAFRSDLHDFNRLIPKNYSIEDEKKINVSVFSFIQLHFFLQKNGMQIQATFQTIKSLIYV